jgi:hypothetical protein
MSEWFRGTAFSVFNSRPSPAAWPVDGALRGGLPLANETYPKWNAGGIMRFRIHAAVGMTAALLLCGLSLSQNSAAQNSNSNAAKADASDLESKREAYCIKTHGLVEYRKPYYNTKLQHQL